jgi:integrase
MLTSSVGGLASQAAWRFKHPNAHSLRRTFASVLYALGESPAVVMAEMGHADPALALRIYVQAMRRDEGETERLRALVEGGRLREPIAASLASHGDRQRARRGMGRRAA